MNQVLGVLENSLFRLERQVDFLAEVVLQNQRGLDLLLMKPGALCILGKNFCSYINQSGVIRKNLVMVRENLKERKERM